MTAGNEITQKVIDRIKNGITKLLVIRQLRLRQRLLKSGSSSERTRSTPKTKKPRKGIYPEELIAIIASFLIIMMAYGGLGLAINAFSWS